MKDSSVICLMGPTASGKTQLAIELVKHFPCEIISVDSAMVYRDMNIGTAKPDAETLKIAPHHLIDFRDPADAYSAAQFKTDALKEMEKIIAHKKIPLLVGGTMLYFRALQQGLSEMPSANTAIREELNKEGLESGWSALHARLQKIDPQAAARINQNDSQRIQRALEVYLLTGKSLTAWQNETVVNENYHFINIAIAPLDRAILHERIAQRFSTMLAEGLVEEVKKLFARDDLTLNTPAIRSVGYRQVWEYLLGNITYEAMREKGIIATRQLAKRQLTWLRSWPGLHWFDSEAPDLMAQVVAFLKG
jgi:tRNA dimethylallyltransferase